MTDFETKWLSPKRKYTPDNLTINLNRKTYDEFKQLGTILEENEVAVIDTGHDRKVTVIGDGKTPAIDCRRIDFPYTQIVCKRRPGGNYMISFVDNHEKDA